LTGTIASQSDAEVGSKPMEPNLGIAKKKNSNMSRGKIGRAKENHLCKMKRRTPSWQAI
jgi:hypothetical protein